MIRSLSDGLADAEMQADILVVGAGIAGLIVATRLGGSGLRIIVAESGSQCDPADDLNEIEQAAERNVSPEARTRGLGGTSLVWGGAMIPFHLNEIARAKWPVDGGELARYTAEIENLFWLPAGPYDHGDANGTGFYTRSAKWPTFARRNLATLLSRQIHSGRGPEILADATATKFDFSPDGLLERVELRSRNGHRAAVRARHVVIAAGGIESVRLLLLADRQNGERIFAPDRLLGRNLHDHLRYPVGPVLGGDRGALVRLAGFRFARSGMHKLRFQPAAGLRSQNIPAGYANIDFDAGEAPAFASLRALYRKLQRRDGVPAAEILRALRHAPWMIRAAWWRIVERRLIFPDGLDTKFYAVVEQAPRVANRVVLSDTGRDRFGCPLARLDWSVSEEDAAAFRRFSIAFVDWWNVSQSAALGRASLDQPVDLRSALAATGGSNHLGGGAAIGTGPGNGVVDRNLATFRVPNMSVISTAVFPSAAGANPTMTLMFAALRLADRLARPEARKAADPAPVHALSLAAK
jgi:choline dehydrogenase-like flavoprotein